MAKIGIIAAMEVEAEELKAALTDARAVYHMGMNFIEGTLDKTPVVVVRSGIGKVNAAICATTLLQRFGVTHVINTGIAGSLDERIRIGDLVISSDAVQHDIDATKFGYRRGVIPQLGISSVFVADSAMRQAARMAAVNQVSNEHVFEGRIVSGDTFVATREQKADLVATFDAICCEMEGASIAHVCSLANVPFVIIRAISDNADEDADLDYPSFERSAAHRCAIITRFVCSHLAR